MKSKIGRPKKEYIKNQKSIRLLDSDTKLLVKDFGTLQRAIDIIVLKYLENRLVDRRDK